jgi:hypothetical protein
LSQSAGKLGKGSTLSFDIQSNENDLRNPTVSIPTSSWFQSPIFHPKS